MPGISDLAIPFRFARRELRAGLKGFRVLMACLALGVAAIAAAGSLNAGLEQALTADARALLGGDVELRRSYQPITEDERVYLSEIATIADQMELRAMAQTLDGQSNRTLVELKGVDNLYPLYGEVILNPAMPLGQALYRQDGVWGAVVDPNLLDRLGLKIGDVVKVGEAQFRLMAIIEKEPDRVASLFSFGPRFMVDQAAIADTGLIQPGSLVRYSAMLKLDRGIDEAALRTALSERFPQAGWRVRSSAEAGPGLSRFLDNMTAFLTLVGLAALLVGGVGVANAVKAFIDGKVRTIAVLKSAGAEGKVVLWTYGMQIAALALVGICVGLALGAALPLAAVSLLKGVLPVEAQLGLYPAPLARAAGFGALTALAFGLWPLARARAIPATALFRDVVAPIAGFPGWGIAALTILAALALAVLAIVSAENPVLAAWFVAGAAVSLALFRGLAIGVTRLARIASQALAGRGRPLWRLGLSNLHRPGAATASVVVSLGLGLTVLVAVALVEGNLSRQIAERLPEEAPSFFFIDIQRDQIDPFVSLVAQADPGAKVERAEMVRGRITRLNGAEVVMEDVAPEAQWAVRGDRGLTTSVAPPDNARIIAGQWWPADYDGPPQVSLAADIAKGLDVGVGDSITVNVLGRDMTAKITSLREIDWGSLGMNFTFILSPGTLDGAPLTYVATVRPMAGRENAVERQVTNQLPNVSAIRVKEALEAVQQVITSAGLAIKAASGVVLATGGLVLAGAVAAGHARRVRDSVVLKAVGATQGDLWRVFLVEYGVLGLVTSLLAGLVGSVVAWAVLTFVMRIDFTFLPDIAAITMALCVLATLAIGYGGTWRALKSPAAPYLRNE